MVIIPAPLEAILLGGSDRAHRLSSKLPAFFQGCCSRGVLAAEQAAGAPHTSETQPLRAFLQTLGLTPPNLEAAPAQATANYMAVWAFVNCR